MAATTVQATVDERVKDQATAIYAAAGLTLSEAFRIMLMRTVADQALPFDPLVPNAETIEAMMAARQGDVVKVGSVDDLLADLHARLTGPEISRKTISESREASIGRMSTNFCLRPPH